MTKKKSKEEFQLSLTKSELRHIRDLLGVVTPPDGEVTISESLAKKMKRTVSEGTLWDKVVAVCQTAKIAVGNNAPSFVVTICGPAPLDVFKIEEHAEV